MSFFKKLKASSLLLSIVALTGCGEINLAELKGAWSNEVLFIESFGEYHDPSPKGWIIINDDKTNIVFTGRDIGWTCHEMNDEDEVGKALYSVTFRLESDTLIAHFSYDFINKKKIDTNYTLEKTN